MRLWSLCALLLVAGPLSAEDSDRAFYVGLDIGVSRAEALDVPAWGVNQGTRCDVLTEEGRQDPTCSDGTPSLIGVTAFEAASGTAAGLRLGYDIGRYRLEIEGLLRDAGERSAAPLGVGQDEGLASKASEWSASMPPGTLSGFRSRELFLVALREVSPRGRWTPYFGLGAGWSRVQLRHTMVFIRKTLAEGYQDVEPPLTLADRPASAAGTVSVFDQAFHGNVFGWKVALGAEYAWTERTGLRFSLRRADFRDLARTGRWASVRSQAPVGNTGDMPLEFRGLGYTALKFGLTHRF